MSVDLPEDGWLLLADAWYPGWQAVVDGHPVPIERADAFFRAVRVGAGAHRVWFRYVPSSFRGGALISGVSWLAWLIAGVVVIGSYLVAISRRLVAKGR